MAVASAKEVVLAAIEAIYSHDPAQAADYYHDDIDYIGYAPIDFFPTMGVRRGKAEAMETIATVQERYSERRYEIEFIAAEEDRVAVILRVHLQKQANDRIVQFQSAHFYKVQDGLIVQQRQFFDSFDLLQQVMEVDLAEVLKRKR
jgi:limonene-1,2-epoxide hydrolase